MSLRKTSLIFTPKYAVCVCLSVCVCIDKDIKSCPHETNNVCWRSSKGVKHILSPNDSAELNPNAALSEILANIGPICEHKVGRGL